MTPRLRGTTDTRDCVFPPTYEISAHIAPQGSYHGAVAIHWTIGADANDPQQLARFWAAALGYVPESGYDDPTGASIVDPEGRGPTIGFLRVPEPKTTKNRFHIDIRVAGEPPWDWAERADLIRAKVGELASAGATVLREETYSDDAGHTVLGHVVMVDPEGNEFCVA